ncbi:ferredoxin [bacterium]|nr:ferredoxin [bacterium]
MAEKLKVTIDREECTSCQVCWESCPDVFEESPEDGLSRITEAYRSENDEGEGLLPEDLESCVEEAAEGCPVEIIRYEILE